MRSIVYEDIRKADGLYADREGGLDHDDPATPEVGTEFARSWREKAPGTVVHDSRVSPSGDRRVSAMGASGSSLRVQDRSGAAGRRAV